jgi:hypothetical protein
MITIFFTGRKLTVRDISPKGSKFNQLYFVDYIFPDLKREGMNFHRHVPQETVWVYTDNLMWPNGSRAALKFKKHSVSRLPHPPYSPDISSCDVWLFGMLKRVSKDREFNSSDGIEEVITKVWD